MSTEYLQQIYMALAKVGFTFTIITVLLLLIASRFKNKQREILWGAGIVIFLSALSGVVFGLLELNNYVHCTAVIIAVCISGVYVVYAEKIYKIQLEKQKQKDLTDEQKTIDPTKEPQDETTSDMSDTTTIEAKADEVILSSRLDTPLAREIFQKAEDARLIDKEGEHYKWVSTKNKVLLAYLCGRIYCNDKCEYDRIEKKYIWSPGKGTFPGSDLSNLFKEPNLSQYRQNRKGSTAPDDFRTIDKLFD